MTEEELADKYAEEYFGKKTELVELWKVKSYMESILLQEKYNRCEPKILPWVRRLEH